MKILCLADLHRFEDDRLAMAEQNAWLRGLREEHDPRVVVVAGDVFDARSPVHPYERIARLFPELPVVCTLGNHEFWYRTVPEVLDHYQELYDPEHWNVHYLDIVGHYDIGHLRFFGNVLWYDGSMATVPGQDVSTFADHQWRDYEIRDFDWKGECQQCVEQIRANRPEDRQTGVLVTHCVPHAGLNGHMVKGRSRFNAYSGVTWLLDEIRPDYAVCGHTHWQIADTVINGVRCVNVGNDYFPPFRHHLLDI